MYINNVYINKVLGLYVKNLKSISWRVKMTGTIVRNSPNLYNCCLIGPKKRIISRFGASRKTVKYMLHFKKDLPHNYN